jgi:hypothetical protein
MDDATRGYFASIERHFVERRGRPLLLSPADVARVVRWHADGIPLKAVLDGIDVHFERIVRRGKAPRRAVTLAYIEDDVLDAWAGARQRRLGRSAPGVASAPEPIATTGEHARLVGELEAAAARLASGADADRALAPSIVEAVTKLRGKAALFDATAADHDEERAEDHLRRLEKSLLTAARAALGPDVDAIESRVEAELADKRARMGEGPWHRVRLKLVDKAIRERFAIPRLSLFYT